jgi:prepilin-type N-terminal cleavage/methylation domain-containing protein/prepilin-type processing-associated H-X9-DG protein
MIYQNRAFFGRGRCGFTLIELLVVTAIVAILLFSVVAGSLSLREKAQSVKCASNLRGIYQLLMQYAQDHKGFLPLKMTYWDAELVNETDAWDQLGLFRCPSDTNIRPGGYTFSMVGRPEIEAPARSYPMNAYLYNLNGGRKLRSAQAVNSPISLFWITKDRDRVWLICENHGAGVMGQYNGAITARPKLENPHGDHANVLMLDGNVTQVDAKNNTVWFDRHIPSAY